MAVLLVKRKYQYHNRTALLSVLVDDVCVGFVKNGDSTKIEVKPGKHNVHVELIAWKSKKVYVDMLDNEEKQLVVDVFKNGKWASNLVIILAVLNIAAAYYFDYYNLSYSLIPALILLIYYLTIGRKIAIFIEN